MELNLYSSYSKLLFGLTMLLAMFNPINAVELDTNFSTDGYDLNTFGGSAYEYTEVKVQSDGKIVAVGYNNVSGTYDMFVVQYNDDGTLDTGFDTDGYKLLNFYTDKMSFGMSLAFQSDGKIVIAGKTRNTNDKFEFVMVRLNSDGSLDTTFDTDGIVLWTEDSSNDFIGNAHVQILSDGKILVGGEAMFSGDSKENYFVAKFTSTGNLDTTFGASSGYTDIAVTGTGSGDTQGMLVDSDGKILIAGNNGDISSNTNGTNGDYAVARFNNDGTIDTTFGGGDGLFEFDGGGDGFHDFGADIAQQGSKYIIVGKTRNSSDYKWSVSRIDSDGTLDTTFGTNGHTLFSGSNTYDFVKGVQVLSDNSILVAGQWEAVVNGRYDTTIAKLTENGALDTSFDDDGVYSYSFNNMTNKVYDMVVDSSGRIITVGSNSNGMIIARFLAQTNSVPTSKDKNITINEDTSYNFVLNDFNFTDADAGDTLESIYITTLETDGNLSVNGSDVVQNQKILAANITNLVFTPVADAFGTPYTTFGFKVSDGEANSTAEYTITINVNDVPEPTPPSTTTPTPTPTPTPEPDNSQLVDSSADELDTGVELGEAVEGEDSIVLTQTDTQSGEQTEIVIPKLEGKVINIVYSSEAIEFTLGDGIASYNNNGTTEHVVSVDNKETIAISYLPGAKVEFIPSGGVQTSLSLGEDGSESQVVIVATPEGASENSVTTPDGVESRADTTIVGTQTVIQEDGRVVVDTPVVVSSLDNNITTQTTLDENGNVIITALKVKPDGTKEVVILSPESGYEAGTKINVKNENGAVYVEVVTKVGSQTFELRNKGRK